MTFRADSSNLDPIGFNDRASSIFVTDGIWEACVDAYFQGGCSQLCPGRYPQLDDRLNRSISSLRVLPGSPASQGYAAPDRRVARATLFEGPNFQGRTFPISGDIVANFVNTGFNDRASSMRIEEGYWLFCSDAQFDGECQTFCPGRISDITLGSRQKDILRAKDSRTIPLRRASELEALRIRVRTLATLVWR